MALGGWGVVGGVGLLTVDLMSTTTLSFSDYDGGSSLNNNTNARSRISNFCVALTVRAPADGNAEAMPNTSGAASTSARRRAMAGNAFFLISRGNDITFDHCMSDSSGGRSRG